ncbi:hypothetical protein M0802_008703 [Mischocyttarus mexicanus]|nr:hypothetical protein M0802_008703 [Mischocyttarus mexicanus]
MAGASLLTIFRLKSLLRNNCYLSSLLNNVYQQQMLRENLNILHYCMKVPQIEGKMHNTSVKKKPKTVIIPKITLLSSNDSMTVVTLEDAERLAKRRNLILIKVEDEKSSSRATYKLVQSMDYFKETKTKNKENEEKNDIKSVKLIQLSTKISMFDLDVKLKNVNRLLKKRHKVKLIVNYDNETPNKILKYIESNANQYGKIEKSSQPNRTVFTIIPILKESNNTNDNLHDVNENIDEKK